MAGAAGAAVHHFSKNRNKDRDVGSNRAEQKIPFRFPTRGLYCLYVPHSSADVHMNQPGRRTLPPLLAYRSTRVTGRRYIHTYPPIHPSTWAHRHGCTSCSQASNCRSINQSITTQPPNPPSPTYFILVQVLYNVCEIVQVKLWGEIVISPHCTCIHLHPAGTPAASAPTSLGALSLSPRSAPSRIPKYEVRLTHTKFRTAYPGSSRGLRPATVLVHTGSPPSQPYHPSIHSIPCGLYYVFV